MSKTTNMKQQEPEELITVNGHRYRLDETVVVFKDGPLRGQSWTEPRALQSGVTLVTRRMKHGPGWPKEWEPLYYTVTGKTDRKGRRVCVFQRPQVQVNPSNKTVLARKAKQEKGKQ